MIKEPIRLENFVIYTLMRPVDFNLFRKSDFEHLYFNYLQKVFSHASYQWLWFISCQRPRRKPLTWIPTAIFCDKHHKSFMEMELQTRLMKVNCLPTFWEYFTRNSLNFGKQNRIYVCFWETAHPPLPKPNINTYFSQINMPELPVPKSSFYRGITQCIFINCN